MTDEIKDTDTTGVRGYSLDEIAALHGLDPWTVRMWVDRFKIEGRICAGGEGMLFDRRAVEQFGELCRLAKDKVKLGEARKHLETRAVDRRKRKAGNTEV